jgi:hypothetical protein
MHPNMNEPVGMVRSLGRARLAQLGLALATALLASCGGDDDSASCGLTPCGGDVVGAWKFSSACATSSSLTDDVIDDCPGATASLKSVKPTGSIDLKSNMTYSGSIALAIDMSITIPQSCLKQGAVTLTCGQLSSALNEVFKDDGGSASCTGSGTCTCTVSQKAPSESFSGTWRKDGNTLVLREQGGSDERQDYCVSGNTLQIRPTTNMAMGMMGSGDEFSLTLTKQ